ncbi:MAG TPA: M48 family metalloprotease [Holophaga sp.]|nr:M48 family metalloprotease [Holophaga sp.]
MPSRTGPGQPRPLSRRDFLATASAAAGGLVLAGCARNPVTGKSQLMLVDEGDERAIDKEQSPHQFSEDFGTVQEPRVNQYVQTVGRALGAKSHRPNVPYSFRVVEASHVNAYAFPAGSIACTRGILLSLDDEAQLAALFGHEVGHVSARHSAARMSQSLLIQAAVAGTAVAVAVKDKRYAPIAGAVGALGSGLLLAKYSRDDERQADALGLEYMVRCGYNPDGMTGLMGMLTSLHEEEPSKLQLMFATHPMGRERLENAQRAIREHYAACGGYPRNRERFMDETAPMRRFKPVVEAIQKGDKALADGKPEAAAPHYQAALKAVPDDYEALVKMSRCLLLQKQTKEAKVYAERAKAVKPGEAQALAAMGLASFQMKDFASSHAAFEAYQKLLPGNPGMYFLDGYSLDQLGRRKEAAVLYQRYLDTGAADEAAAVAQKRLAALQ